MSQSRVFVLDKHHPARARELLREGKAVVHRRVPFVIRLKQREGGDVQPVRVTLDPGSKTTGLAVVRESKSSTPAPTPAEDGPVRHTLCDTVPTEALLDATDVPEDARRFLRHFVPVLERRRPHG